MNIIDSKSFINFLYIIVVKLMQLKMLDNKKYSKLGDELKKYRKWL